MKKKYLSCWRILKPIYLSLFVQDTVLKTKHVFIICIVLCKTIPRHCNCIIMKRPTNRNLMFKTLQLYFCLPLRTTYYTLEYVLSITHFQSYEQIFIKNNLKSVLFTKGMTDFLSRIFTNLHFYWNENKNTQIKSFIVQKLAWYKV